MRSTTYAKTTKPVLDQSVICGSCELTYRHTQLSWNAIHLGGNIAVSTQFELREKRRLIERNIQDLTSLVNHGSQKAEMGGQAFINNLYKQSSRWRCRLQLRLSIGHANTHIPRLSRPVHTSRGLGETLLATLAKLFATASGLMDDR